MVAPIELYKQKYPELAQYSDYTLARNLYDKFYKEEFPKYDEFRDYFTIDPESLETQRFGRRADLVNYPEDQTTTMGEDLIGGLKKGIAGLKTTGYGIAAGAQGLIGDEEDQEYYLQKAREAELAQAQIVPGYQHWRDAYAQEGISGLTGHLLQAAGLSAPETAQGALGFYAGAKIGGALGTAAGPLGTLAGGFAGGIIGSTIALAPSFFGRNVLRQDQSVREGERVDINEFQALMTAPAQAAADSVIYALLPRALKMTNAEAGITKKILKGAVIGVPTEAGTEVFQQFLERAQAGGLEYATSADAMREYEEAAVIGGALGGVIGGAVGPFNIESKNKLDQIASESLANQSKPAVDLDEEIIEEVETDIPTPTVLEREEVTLTKDEVKNVKDEAKVDSQQSFNAVGEGTVDQFLNEKIQTIADTQGEAQAKEYYKTFQNEYFKKRGLPAPTFEQITRKVKFKPKGPQVGQPRFEVDEVKTEQFIDGKGFVVRDNKRGGEDSLAFRTKEEAQAYIDGKGKPTLTKADVVIPKKPAEGFAWDSDKQQWVDKWEGQRGTEELADLTEAEIKAAKVVKDKKGKETFTAGAINLTDLTPKQRRLLFENRNRKNFRKDPEKYNFTDLKELKDANVIPKDARFIANLTPKQRKLLKDRRKTNKDQIYTTNRELNELGVIGGTEIKADIESQVKENLVEEKDAFDVGFELKPVLEKETETIGGKKYVRDEPIQKFEVIKTLKDKETGNVVQEKVDSIHEEENVASARLRYLQKQNNLPIDKYAGEPVINSKELVERSPELGSMAIFVNDVINKISPTTNVLFATDRIVAPEGSLGFSTSEETVGDIQGWYDQAGDTMYLSLQNLEGMLDAKGNPTPKIFELISHESFHALRRQLANAKKKGVFTEKERKALDEAFPGGKIENIPDWVQKTLGKDAMDYLTNKYGTRDLDTEEMQAYVFQAWNTQRAFNKRPPVGNIIQRAFNKIGEILTKTKRFLQGKGYNTWESVFKLAGEGKVGRRGFDFKTKEEAEAFGKKRAEELEEAKDVPTRTDVDFEEAKDRKLVDALDVGERVITPADAQYSVERTTNYPPTSSELKKPINSNNSIFKPLGFRPSQDAINTLNDSAKKYIEAKQSKKKGLERQRLLSEADKLSTDFKNKLVSEKPERVKEAVIKEMMQPMVNSAVAENQGHKFNIKDPDTDESITIGRGSELVGEDAKIHKDLSNVSINRKPLFRAIRDTAYPVEERIEDKKAVEAGERAAEKLEKAGLTEEQIEAREQEEARKVLGIKEETKPKRPTLKLPPKFSVAVDMIDKPPIIEGTGKIQKGKKKILVENVLDYLENDTRSKNNEQPLDITNEDNFQNFVEQGVAEFEYQMTQPETGMGWYDTDVEEAMALLDEYIPELKEYPVYKELMPFLTGIASAGTPVGGDWKVGIKVIKNYIETGQIPSINTETGKAFTRYPSTRMALEFTNWYVQKNGLKNFLTWLDTPTTIKDINALRKESGVYKSIIQPKGRENIIGADMFGPKVGPFMKKLNGIQDDVSVLDVWMNRHFNRKAGNLWQRNADGSFRTDKNGNRVAADQSRNDQERNIVNRYIQEIAKRVGQNTEDTQAVLWYFEQGLYTKLGVKSEPTSYAEKTREEFKDVSKRDIRKGEEVDTRKVQRTAEEKAETKIADNYVKGPDPNLEAEGKESVVDIVPETGVLFSTESLMGNNNDEGIVSMSDIIIDDKVKSSLSGVDKTYVSKIDKLRKKYPKLGGWLANTAIEARMGLQDKGYGTRRILDAIERKLGMKLTDPELEKKYGLIDPYVAEELFHGRTGERLAELQSLRIDPILETLEKNKIPIGDLDLYLYAKHAKERNAVIYNKWKNKEKGFEKLTEEDAQSGSGMTNEQADIILADFKTRDDFKILEDISKQVNEMMRSNLETLYDGGIISKELRDNLLNQFENYVPLRGIDFEMDAEETNWKLGVPLKRTEKKLKVTKPPGFQVRKEGKEVKLGRGRGILDENIREARNTFAQAMIKLHNDIVRAERNRVAKSLYDFAKFYQSEVDSNTDGLWTIMEDPANPDQAATIKEFEEQLESFRREKGRLKGKWKTKNPGESFKFIIDGKEKVMLLENEYLARFFNNIGAQSGNMFTNALGRVTRYLAMINTGYNPEFVVANLLRDLQTAGINISDEQTVQLRGNMFKNWKKALKGAYNVERNANAKGEWENIYRNYKRSGGKVGFFTSIKTLENQLDEIQSELGNLNTEKKSNAALKKGSKFLKGVGKYISDVNAAVENAVRVSAYQAALDAGFTETQAASLSKNLTVNFNRKGEWGGLINSMYLFYNASIQGSVRVLQASFRSPKIRKILYGITAGSFLLDMLNRMVAGEDEDGRNRYDKLSGWVKAHNLILFLPGTEKYIAIPMPYGYNVMAVLGQTMASSMPEDMGGSNKRQVSIGDNATRTVGSMFNAFNPVGGSSSVVEFVSPTVLKPAVQLMQNEDYAGRSIYPPDNPFDGNAGPPDSQRFWNASSISQVTANTLNSLTGGSKVEKGFIDFSPETMDFWFGHVFGGVGAFTGRTAELGKNILTGQWDEIGTNQVPFTRRVYKSQPTFVDKQTYFDIRDEVKIAENLIEYHREEGNKEALKNIRKDRGSLLRLRPMIKGIESQRRKIRQQIKFVEDSKRLTEDQKKDKIKKLLDRESLIIQRFIKRADRILG